VRKLLVVSVAVLGLAAPAADGSNAVSKISLRKS
jgi:hypothetical protein